MWDEGVGMLDAEAFHAEWSGVRPGVDYVPGALEAEQVAGVLRALYRQVGHRGSLGRVQAMTDLDGRPCARVERMHEVLDLQRGGGTREGVHSHHLKGSLWCKRCSSRLW